MTRRIHLFLSTSICTLFFITIGWAQTPVYLDSTQSVDVRVEDLLSRMTIDEKIGQMTQADHAAVNNLSDVQNYFLGSILSGGGSDPATGNSPSDWADLYDSFQLQALATRLGIPIIYGIDAVHGHSNVVGATIFPHNIGMGATRDSTLIEQAGRITAIEIAATGIDWTFAPCVAVPRDERWGRTYEGYGETPELVSMAGAAAVRGLQHDSLQSKTSVVACAKHYLGDGGTTGGDDQGNTEVSEQELRAIHLPGYIAAINNGVRTIMASYSSWNGVKMHGNQYLLSDVLKGELGFSGFIVSDWAAIDQLPGDYASDVETSINAGIDMVMVPNNYVEFFNTLKTLVQQGKVAQNRIDDAVRRILRVKFEMGLFEHPLTDRSLLPLVGSVGHRAVARQCVQESQVLLKKNDQTLPLPKTAKRILVAGEHADNIGLQCGGWTIYWQGGSGNITTGTTILEGLREAAPGVEFIYDASANFDTAAADYAIAVIGESPYAEGGGDQSDLTIKKSQIELVHKLKQRGQPVITILISGRPMIIDPVWHDSDVLIAAWLPGTEGQGVADVLFGDAAPHGMLPMSWPKSMTDIPINQGDNNYDPLFAYGYGITSFQDSESGSAPVAQSALLREDGDQVELSFNKTMNHPGNSQAVFTLVKNGQTAVDITDFNLDSRHANILILDLAETLSKDDTLSLSYLSGNLHSADGGSLAPFSDLAVINYLKYAGVRHVIPDKIEAEDYSDMSGIQTEPTSDIGGGENVGWIDDNDWLEYRCDVQTSGEYTVNYRVASYIAGGTMQLLMDGALKDSIDIPVTGAWQSWTTISAKVTLESGTHTMRLVAQKGGFNINWLEFVLLTSVQSAPEVADNFMLLQNYPNPFNPVTTIRYRLDRAARIKLTVFNTLGQKIALLAEGWRNAGRYQVKWDGKNDASQPVPSGVYFYRLDTGGRIITKKMLFIR